MAKGTRKSNNNPDGPLRRSQRYSPAPTNPVEPMATRMPGGDLFSPARANVNEVEDDANRNAARTTMETIEEEMDRLSGDEIPPRSSTRAEDLYRNYLQSTSGSIALSTSVKRLVDHGPLRMSDVVDYSIAVHKAKPRFGLIPRLRTVADMVVKELQRLLNELAAEVPARRERNLVFLIDPLGDLVPTLSGASSIEELAGDWTILRERIERASRFVLKYVKEAREEVVSSPISTNPEAYGVFEEKATIDTRLHEFMAYVPAHQ